MQQLDVLPCTAVQSHTASNLSGELHVSCSSSLCCHNTLSHSVVTVLQVVVEEQDAEAAALRDYLPVAFGTLHSLT